MGEGSRPRFPAGRDYPTASHGIVGALLGVSLGGAFLDLWAAAVSGVIGFSLGTVFGERGVAWICWAIRRLPWWVAW
jgi:hypothetical protein